MFSSFSARRTWLDLRCRGHAPADAYCSSALCQHLSFNGRSHVLDQERAIFSHCPIASALAPSLLYVSGVGITRCVQAAQPGRVQKAYSPGHWHLQPFLEQVTAILHPLLSQPRAPIRPWSKSRSRCKLSPNRCLRNRAVAFFPMRWLTFPG